MRRFIHGAGYVCGFLFLILSAWWVLSRAPFEWRVVHFWALVSAMAMQVIAVFVATGVWRQVVRISAGLDIRWSGAALQVCLNLVGKYLPGKVWGFALRHRTLTGAGTTNRQAASALALEQASLLATACVVSIPAIMVLARDAPDLLVPAMIGSSVLIGLLVSRRPRRWILGALSVTPAKGLVSRIVGLSLLQWTVSGTCMILIAHGLGVALDGGTAVILASAVPAAVVAGMLAFFVPGGIGVREGVLVLLCGPAIGPAPALACALALRILATARDVLCGLAVPLLVRIERRAPADATPLR